MSTLKVPRMPGQMSSHLKLQCHVHALILYVTKLNYSFFHEHINFLSSNVRTNKAN